MLHNDLISLRTVEPEDAEYMYLSEADPELWKYSRRVAPLSREQLRTYALTYNADPVAAGQLRLIIMENATAAVVGMLDIFDIDVADSNCAVGIYINPDKRRHGFGLSAVLLGCEYLSAFLHLRNVIAHVASSNVGSLELFVKAGFREAGSLKDWLQEPTGPEDMLILQRSLI